MLLGMGAPITGVTPIFAISFLGFGIGKRLQQSHPNEQLTLVQFFNAGAFSAFGTTIIMAPGERIKCLLQVQQAAAGGPTKYAGPIDCIRQLYRAGGISSIYRGTAATLLRGMSLEKCSGFLPFIFSFYQSIMDWILDVPASGVYFMTYEWLQIALAPKDAEKGKLSPLRTMLAGGLAGIANWIIAIPPDVLKSRLQTGEIFRNYEFSFEFYLYFFFSILNPQLPKEHTRMESATFSKHLFEKKAFELSTKEQSLFSSGI